MAAGTESCQSLATTATVAAAEGSAARRKVILVAPAMNTQVYLHPLIEEQLTKLRSWGWIRVLSFVERLLVCGDLGVGGMMVVADIVGNVESWGCSGAHQPD